MIHVRVVRVNPTLRRGRRRWSVGSAYRWKFWFHNQLFRFGWDQVTADVIVVVIVYWRGLCFKHNTERSVFGVFFLYDFGGLDSRLGYGEVGGGSLCSVGGQRVVRLHV